MFDDHAWIALIECRTVPLQIYLEETYSSAVRVVLEEQTPGKGGGRSQ
jgi:hypothetical protein